MKDPFGLDLRSLAYARILMGCFVLWDIFWRLQLSIHWYTSNSPWSITHVEDTPHGAPIHRFFFYRGSEQLQWFFFTVQILFAIGLIVGFKTNSCTLLSWILLTMLHGRQESINDGSDRFFRNLLLWCTFIPIGKVCSVDARRALRAQKALSVSGKVEESLDSTYSNIGTAGLTLQIVFLYYGAVAQRWRQNQEWFPSDGSAMHYIMSGSIHATGIARLFSNHPHITYLLTLQATAFELLLPTCILFTSSRGRGFGRICISMAMSLFHIGIRLTLVLTNFTLVNLIVAIMLLPSSVHDVVGQVRSVESMSRMKIKLGRVLLIYMILNFCAVDLNILPSFDHGNIGEAIRSKQDWRLFHRVKKQGWWINILGSVHGKRKFQPLSTVDVLNGWTNGDWSSLNRTQQAEQERIRVIQYQRYPGWRFERWVFLLLSKDTIDRKRKLAYLGRFLCHLFQENNENAKDPCKKDIKIHFSMYSYPIFPPQLPIDERYGRPSRLFQQQIQCLCQN